MSGQHRDHLPKDCPHCGGTELYVRRLSSAGGHGPYLLQGLGSFLHYADFDVVVCAGCGLTRFFAGREARGRVREHQDWKRLS
jgi:predicted nucleic-acid-binding Zn-ribbon protein